MEAAHAVTCSYCGSELEEGANFCGACGARAPATPEGISPTPQPDVASVQSPRQRGGFGRSLAAYTAMLILAMLGSFLFAYFISVGNWLWGVFFALTFVCSYFGAKSLYDIALSVLSTRSRYWTLAVAGMGALMGASLAGVFESALASFVGPLATPLLAEPANLPGLFEEAAKQVGVVIVGAVFPAFLASKRRAYALGLVAGAVFALLEDSVYVGTSIASPLARLLSFPAHPMWSAIAAVGVALAVHGASRETGRVFGVRDLLRGPSLRIFVLVFLLHEVWDVGSGLGLLVSFPVTLVFFVRIYRGLPHDFSRSGALGIGLPFPLGAWRTG